MIPDIKGSTSVTEDEGAIKRNHRVLICDLSADFERYDSRAMHLWLVIMTAAISVTWYLGDKREHTALYTINRTYI